ncbi:MAG TPA: zinc ribbon domain-containing protein [Candidatus Tectomicrobia bacterium]|nr:zinc ribbon domain-containing protein [Candidatus Tectomicrobia bacterium]
MAGIVSYGAYVPLFRLGKGTAAWESPTERAVANFDEDSVTMGVAALRNALAGMDPWGIDALYFATTTQPYAEKQSATTIGWGANLRTDIFTVDCTDSLRAGTNALKLALDATRAGSAQRVAVVAADNRLAQPRSAFERAFGDGAAALVVGTNELIATIEDHVSFSHEIMDTWRPADDEMVRSWEDRFRLEKGFIESLRESSSKALKKFGTTAKDYSKVIFSAPDARAHREATRALGLEAAQVQDGLFSALGNTGTAFPLMLLIAAIEDAKPGDRLLLASYGDGCDVFSLQVTPEKAGLPTRRGMKAYLAAKKVLPDYEQYLKWRGLHQPDPGVRRPPMPTPSATALFRERERNLRFCAAKCRACGTVQYPPQRVCTKCGKRDDFDPVRLADKPAKLFTYALDYIAGSVDVPLAVCIVNFEGGGRALMTMTDRVIEDIEVDMPLEMSFRKLYEAEGIHNYFWKCTPVRVRS